MSDLLNTIKQMEELCDVVDRAGYGITHINPQKKLREMMRMELIAFALYVTASDGKVSDKEAGFIGSLMGAKLSPDVVAQVIEQTHVYSTSFERTIPQSLRCFVKMDCAMIDSGKEMESKASHSLVKLFQEVGREIATTDRRLERDEMDNVISYIQTLDDFVKTHLNEKLAVNPPAS